jgi:hypothetical protein
MKWLRLLSLTTLLLALVAPGAAWAAPTVVNSFTISPNTTYAGNAVTFQVNFTVASADVLTRNTLCFFYQDGSYDATFAALGPVMSGLGDSYSPSVQATAGSASTDCAGLTGYKILEYSTPAADQFSDGGDQLSFSFVVPAGATTQIFRLRQLNAASTIVGVMNATLTIQVLGNQIYVANDVAGCGSNSPCLTGPTALNAALDGVSSPGDVIVLGNYLISPNTPADVTAVKTVTISGAGGASVSMAAGVCSGATIVNNGGALTIQNLIIDGTCASGNRTAAISNVTGTLNVRNVTIRNFTGSGIGIAATGDTTIVEGSTFSGNQTALDANGGTLYAFANNVTTNLGLNAAANIETGDNVRCNYWSSSSISGGDSAAQFEARLGSPVSTYIEGTGALSLGRASLAAGTGSRVIVNLGRSTSAPPFGNGTVIGLGALTSDFFAVCLARDGTVRGDLTIVADNVTPGPTGHRLYHITTTTECSPSTNTACWDFTGQSSTSAGAALTDSTANEGHYVIGNQVDPTAIAISSLSANGSSQASGAWLVLFTVASVLSGIWLWLRRRQQIR